MNSRNICAFVFMVIVLIAEINAATTKSWQHSDKMKQIARSTKNKVNNKLSLFDNVQPTPSMGQKVGGFEDNSSTNNQRTGAKKPVAVNNKLDKIQSKAFLSNDDEFLPKYDIGPGVNLTLDVGREIVNVNLDEDYLKDVFQGRNYPD